MKSQITDPVTQYINSIGAYAGPYKPNFIAFDRFERDDFYVPQTAWFYNRHDWKNYLTYVNNISRALNVPAMIWQIPGGHLLTNHDTSTLTLDHVATAPDFFFGDANVSENFPNNIRQSVLDYNLDPSAYGVNSSLNAGQYLQTDVNHNWNKSELKTAVENNIVAILWGGGSTTAVASISTNGSDGGWLANKVEQYYQHPVPLVAQHE